MIISKSDKRLKDILARAEMMDDKYLSVASGIVSRIAKEGDAALFELTKKFDKFDINPENMKVSEKEFDDAFKSVPKELIDAIRRAADNVLSFHQAQKEKSWFIEKDNGVILGQKVTPIARAGVYVPGGKASYFSSVLMNILPAVAAGVEDITMTTPAMNGEMNPCLLVAAKIAGATRVYKVGGAQAIAALAYGTENIQKVDKITGPGNIYVALAKKLVFGIVDIDMIAGPSEILIIAGPNANPKYIAADMLAQAEHDELASAVCVTYDKELAKKVEYEVKRQLELLPRRDIARQSIDRYSAIIIADDLDDACNIANDIAPEHLELYIDSPMENIGKIKNAGAIFLGGNSPEAIGDYFAGPNHVLPTGGSARFFSPLGTYDFIKRSSIIYYTKEQLIADSDFVMKMAEAEQLSGHARSVGERMK